MRTDTPGGPPIALQAVQRTGGYAVSSPVGVAWTSPLDRASTPAPTRRRAPDDGEALHDAGAQLGLESLEHLRGDQPQLRRPGGRIAADEHRVGVEALGHAVCCDV